MTSRQLAMELHELLRQIDPARFHLDLAAAIRERVERIAAGLATLAEHIAAVPALAALHQRIDLLQVELRAALPDPALVGAALEAAWSAFRARLQPADEALAQALRAEDIHLPSLRPTNYTRNIVHVAGAVVALVALEALLPAAALPWLAATVAGTAWTMEISRRRWPAANAVMMRMFGAVAHPHEAHRVNSSTWYMTALFILSLTGMPVLCALAVAVLGLADPAAALVGRRFGRIRLVNGRSLEGSLTFVVVGAAAAFATLRLWHPEISAPLAVAFAAALPAALAELWSRRVDDNLSVPLAAAAGAGAWLTWIA